MTKREIIKKTENYVKKCMKNLSPNVHDFKHVDRVRKWAIKIAKAEHRDLFLTEMAALLHDIGRAKENPPKILHADIGAKMTYNFLTKNKSPHLKKGSGDKSPQLRGKCGDKLVSLRDAEQITYAVVNHGKGGKGWLVEIIQDADKLDGLGAIGIIRTSQHAYKLPDYEEKNILGKTKWKKDEATKILKKRGHIAKSVIENLNFQITWYDNIHTKSAKEFAKPLVKFMKEFRKLFIKQIKIK